MDERVFFAAAEGGARLFCHYHPAVKPRAALLYCQPFAEERAWSHAIAAQAARAFAEAGVAVLRFDYEGCGDSSGDFDEARPERWIAQIRALATWLRGESGAPRFGYWGLRLGAALALEAAREAPADGLLFWQPVLDAGLHAQQFLRQAVAGDLAAGQAGGVTVAGLQKSLEGGATEEIAGYPVRWPLIAGLKAVGKPVLPSGFRGALGCFQAGTALPPPLRAFLDQAEASGATVRAQAVDAEPYWDRPWRHACPVLLEESLIWAREFAA